jgi:hypothetical protein
MAGLPDPLTDLPPPSRFDPDDLNTFAAAPAPPPSPPLIVVSLSCSCSLIPIALNLDAELSHRSWALNYGHAYLSSIFVEFESHFCCVHPISNWSFSISMFRCFRVLLGFIGMRERVYVCCGILLMYVVNGGAGVF